MADAPVEEPTGYQSLYRRFRPQRFSEVLGQDHVAVALRNAVREGRIGHAYLFSGPRGTGKTSTARILGKALNCTDLDDGEPCGRCASCVSITAGASFDVHELDAASNNGVDAMRDLVARASLATPGRWKVYIVDEVHMLSTAAANALLKTLEEPPDHVVFVLATTDAPKVLPTIRSRTQHFEFHLLSDEVLNRMLEDVARQAGLDLPDWAVGQAVRRARGSARDALSTLDQVAASGVVEDDPSDWVRGVLDALVAYDQAAALVALEQAVRAGHDPAQLGGELLDELRVGFLALVSNGVLAPERGATSGAVEAARELGTVRVVRAIEGVGQALVSMRDAADPRVAFEVALLRLTRPEDERTLDALTERVERLERRLADAVTAPAPHPAEDRPGRAGEPTERAVVPTRPEPPAAGEPSAPTAPDGTAGDPSVARRPALGAFLRGGEPAPSPVSGPDPAPPADVVRTDAPSTPGPEPTGAQPSRDELVAAWGDTIVTRLRPKVRAYFQVGRFTTAPDGTTVFALPNQHHVERATPLADEVASALAAHFGRPVALRLVVDPNVGSERAEADDQGRSLPARAREEVAALMDDFDAARSEEGEPPGAATGVALARERLLEAFPGAEEVADDRSVR